MLLLIQNHAIYFVASSIIIYCIHKNYADQKVLGFFSILKWKQRFMTLSLFWGKSDHKSEVFQQDLMGKKIAFILRNEAMVT